MNIYTHIITTLFALLMPLIVYAAEPPASVTGIAIAGADGEVTVTWNAPDGEPIAYYRVYYSSVSILENDGLYDDFEVTEDKETSLTFTPPRTSGSLFVSVIAVSEEGLESEFFIEEASIDLSALGTSAAESSSSEAVRSTASAASSASSVSSTTTEPVVSDTPIKLLSGVASAPTTISIEFSEPVTVDPSRAPEGLTIEAPDGTPLAIARISIRGKTLTITTETQTKNAVYLVEFSEPFSGISGQPLDEDARSVLVTGHSDGRAAVVVEEPITSDTPVDLEDVTIDAYVQDNGLYTVTVEWDASKVPSNAYGIVAYQTRDAQFFGEPALIPTDVRGVALSNVTGGFFGIYLQVLMEDRQVSTGVFRYISLEPGIGTRPFSADVAGAQEEQTDDAEGIAPLAAISEQEMENADIVLPAAYEPPPSMRRQRMMLVGTVSTVLVLLIAGIGYLHFRRRSTNLQTFVE